jgi:hypothetical protein
MTQQAVKNSTASGTKTSEHNESAACVGTEKLYGYQDGIVETVRLVLEEAASGNEPIMPNIAGALGLKLRAASGWYSPLDSRRTSLSDVAHILLAAAQEKLGIHPVLAGVFASLLTDEVSGSARQVQAPAPMQSARSAPARQSLDLGSAGLRSGTEKTASSPSRCEARHNDNTACGDEIITVSGYYTPEEAAELIGKIRDWLSGCRDRHSLADLMESIKQKFKLFDSQLGELLGISDRLVGHVRHGRPSPFAKARFVEVFGTAGGADADRG